MNAQNGWMSGERVRHSSLRIGAPLMLVIGLAVSLFGFVEDASAAQGLRFSLVKTAQSESGDFLMGRDGWQERSEENTSELQSLMRISYAVFCLTKNIYNTSPTT